MLNKDSALLTLLDDSDATLGPGLISIPDIINKIHNTKNRYLHISITELSGKSRIEIKQRTECHQWQGSYADVVIQ
jgi:hypothetical protein